MFADDMEFLELLDFNSVFLVKHGKGGSTVIKIGKPWYWVHGHVHHFLDYFEGQARVLCNVRGNVRGIPVSGVETVFHRGS
uniref:Uncharacterized protein n=1 Tax=Sinorhizobium sp. M14 TaxID=430451 RepID=A0A142BPS3_9HYPH|nr:hypothetical protein pSinB_222 [Sinorhizobium sp. M14]